MFLISKALEVWGAMHSTGPENCGKYGVKAVLNAHCEVCACVLGFLRVWYFKGVKLEHQVSKDMLIIHAYTN